MRLASRGRRQCVSLYSWRPGRSGAPLGTRSLLSSRRSTTTNCSLTPNRCERNPFTHLAAPPGDRGPADARERCADAYGPGAGRAWPDRRAGSRRFGSCCAPLPWWKVSRYPRGEAPDRSSTWSSPREHRGRLRRHLVAGGPGAGSPPDLRLARQSARRCAPRAAFFDHGSNPPAAGLPGRRGLRPL
jgi:hypothetical protein